MASHVLTPKGNILIFCSFDQFPIYKKYLSAEKLFVESVPLVFEKAQPFLGRRNDQLRNIFEIAVLAHGCEKYERNLGGRVFFSL